MIYSETLDSFKWKDIRSLFPKHVLLLHQRK